MWGCNGGMDGGGVASTDAGAGAAANVTWEHHVETLNGSYELQLKLNLHEREHGGFWRWGVRASSHLSETMG